MALWVKNHRVVDVDETVFVGIFDVVVHRIRGLAFRMGEVPEQAVVHWRPEVGILAPQQG